MAESLVLTVFLDLQDQGGSFVSYVGRNMLFYPIPQSLGCASYVTRITLARKFINEGTFWLVGTQSF